MAHTIEDHLKRYNDGWIPTTASLPINQDIIISEFRRGNLVLNKKILPNRTTDWRMVTAKKFLILGKVWVRNEAHYLAKMSYSTTPTLNSKGHILVTVKVKDMDTHFKLSIASAFKDL